MLLLPEVVSRRWEEAKAELESSVRSGSRPGSGVDVEAILNEIAGLIRSVGRDELESVARASGATPRPVPRIVSVGANATADFPAAGNSMATTDGSLAGQPGMTADLPAARVRLARGLAAPLSDPHAATGALDGVENELDFVVKGGTRPDGKTPTIDQTGEFSVDVEPVDDTERIVPSGGEKAKRKVPIVPGYDIIGVLGRGGMGVVYKATQVGLRRTVALKMILSGEHASGAQLGRFEAEARAVALIHHPGIVQIFEIGEHDGLPYFSLEYCPGGSLDKRLKHEPQPPKEAASLTEKLARAMAAAHTAGVIHRDIKPANVLFDGDGMPKITDFGLARELDDTEGQTRTGSILGTPSYMSPEQASGSKDVGPAADQYSIGATLYELITGRPPFQGSTVMETVTQVRTREPVAPIQLQPGCPKDLETICLKALQKEPGKRYSSCAALADDLKAYLDGRPIAARPVSRAEKAWRWAKRNPRIAGLAAAVALLLLVLSVGGATAAVVFDNKKRQAEGLAEDRRIAQELAERARDEKDVALKSEQKALAAETIAHKAEEQEFAFTRATVFVALDEIPLALTQAVFARGAEQQVLEALGAMLEKQIGRDSLMRGLPDRARLNFLMKMGDLEVRRGKPKEAEKTYRDALVIADRLVKEEEREKDKAKGNRALILRKLGSLCRDFYRERGAEALKFYAEAVAIQREIATAPTTGEIPPAEAKASLAGTLLDIAETYFRSSLFDRALPPCEESLKLWGEVAKLPATAYTVASAQSLADTQVLCGKILARLDRNEVAEKVLGEATTEYRKIVAAKPGNVAVQIAAAGAYREHGDFLLMNGKLDAATPLHEWDLELSRGLLRTPELIAAQKILADVYYRSATLALKKGNRPAAEKFYRQCLDLRLVVAETRPTDPRQTIYVANAQARCGLHAEAFKSMDSMVAKFPDDRYAVRQAAFNIAICPDAVQAGRPDSKLAPAEIALRDKYADHALTLLEDLVNRLGYKDVVQLKTDPDLDAVRADRRFKAILDKLEKGAVKP